MTPGSRGLVLRPPDNIRPLADAHGSVAAQNRDHKGAKYVVIALHRGFIVISFLSW